MIRRISSKTHGPRKSPNPSNGRPAQLSSCREPRALNSSRSARPWIASGLPTPTVLDEIERLNITFQRLISWSYWNSHDITKVLSLFAKDVEIDQPENVKPLDYNGARKFFSMIFRAYPDFHVAVLQAIVDGRSAVSVERVTGTWTGPFVNPNSGKATPGNGRHFDHPGAMVLLYDANGKIRHVSIYWDQLTVDRQLRIVPR